MPNVIHKAIMKTKLFCIILFAVALPSLVSAQSAIQRLEKIRSAYKEAISLSAQVEVMAYKDKADAVGSLVGTGLFHKDGTSYYSKFNKEEMLINSNCTLVIDHEEKQVMWFKPLKKAIMQNQLFNIDSLLKNGTAVDKGIENGLQQFIFYSEGIIEQTAIFADVKSNFVTKIISYYKTTAKKAAGNAESEDDDTTADIYKAVVIYKNISTAKADAKVFSENKFIEVKNNKTKLRPAYADYKLVINTENGI